MQLTWVIVIVIVALILLGIAVYFSRRGRRRRDFEVRQLPPELVSSYQGRIAELESMFVSQPREAVAAARLMVDDMLVRMGYPVRLNDDERIRDLQGTDSSLGERYRLGTSLKNDATTEQLRRAMQSYLEISRNLTGSAAAPEQAAEAQQTGRPRLAG
jgi:hypothetical protein